MKLLISLLIISIQIIAPLKGQSDLKTPLPENTYLLEMSFDERLIFDPYANYYVHAGKDYYQSVLRMAEQGNFKLYKGPNLEEEWDLAELRKSYMAKYEEENSDFLDGGDDPADSFSETVFLNRASGTAGVVEEIRIEGDEMVRKRVCGYFAWGNWEAPEHNVKVYFKCDSEGFPWNKLEFKRLAGAFSDAGEDYIMDHYLYGFYPELVVMPGSKSWQRLVYDPLPGIKPKGLMAEWEQKLGRPYAQFLYAAPAIKKTHIKNPYKLLVTAKPDGHEAISSMAPKPDSWSGNERFLEEFINALILKALHDEITVYWPDNPGNSLNFLAAHQDALATLEEREIDLDEDDWSFEEPSPEELQKEIDAVDLSSYTKRVKVVGALRKSRDGAIEWVPLSLILVLNPDGAKGNEEEVGMVLLEDITDLFDGKDVREFLQSDACYKYPASIMDQKLYSPEEAFYVHWFLMNDWDNIPHRDEVTELKKAGQLKGELETLYGK